MSEATGEWSPVVFILIDGLRPDAAVHVPLPRLDALMARGAWTRTAQSTMPSITLPCHMTMFHSVPPARHGVTTNVYTPMARPLPGLFDHAKALDKRSIAVYNWEPLRDLGKSAEEVYVLFNNNRWSRTPQGELAAQAPANAAALQQILNLSGVSTA